MEDTHVKKESVVESADRESESVRGILATNIVAYRQKLKMTRAELAAKVGITEAAIGQYERATRTPTIDYICKLSNVFGVPVDELVEHEKGGYEPVKEYRFDKASNFVRRLGLAIFETPEGTIKICRRNETKPQFQSTYGKVVIKSVEEKFKTLVTFGNREDFIVFVESFIEDYILSAAGVDVIFLDSLENIKRGLPPFSSFITVDNKTPF